MKVKVIVDQKNYEVEIESLFSRPIVAIVEGSRYEVWLEEAQSVETPAEKAPAAKAEEMAPPATGHVPSGATLSAKTVRAPIPGVIVAIQVKVGDQVEFSQPLFTIEAMKMRNAIRASRAGAVKEVFVSIGQTVNYNDLLLEFVE